LQLFSQKMQKLKFINFCLRKGADVKLNSKMKKIVLILMAVIGFAFAANAQDCSGTCSWCRAPLKTDKIRCPKYCSNGIVVKICTDCVQCTDCKGYKKQKCNSNDGRNQYDRWTHCPNCSLCGGDGLMNGTQETGCTCCGGTPKQAGAGWVYGCRCTKCNKEYVDCK